MRSQSGCAFATRKQRDVYQPACQRLLKPREQLPSCPPHNVNSRKIINMLVSWRLKSCPAFRHDRARL
jgi:hypothetical protein